TVLAAGDQAVIDTRHNLLDDLGGRRGQREQNQGGSQKNSESLFHAAIHNRSTLSKLHIAAKIPRPQLWGDAYAASRLANSSSQTASFVNTSSPSGDGSDKTRAGERRAPRVWRTRSSKRSASSRASSAKRTCTCPA